MTRKGEQFAGVTVALVTPFRDGHVDEERLRKNIDWLIEQDVDCVAPCGTTGESPTLSHDEHERVISVTCEHVAGRIRVMAGTGSNSTREAISMTKSAQAAGADGTLQVAPYYNKPTQEGFYRHFAAIADACDLPQVLYNIPGRSAVNIEPETICRLAEIDSIVAIKEASGSMDQASALLTGCDLTLLSGDDSLTLPLMAMGGSGIVSVAANIVPADMKALVVAFREGDIAKAQQLHAKLYPLCYNMLKLASNPIPLKAAMNMLGTDTGDVRLPLVPLDETARDALAKTLADCGLT